MLLLITSSAHATPPIEGTTTEFVASDIATSADLATSVYAADMDNDGDMDVLSTSGYDDTIAWYENDGTADPSFTASVIATSADYPYSVFAADMDNDGDMDVLSTSIADDTIAWYENDGAADPTFTAHNIATSVYDPYSVFAADMDNDGDLDVLSASTLDDTIAWYENDGAADPTFIASDITTSADGASSVFAADMDNDGDMDILSASYLDDTIAWYENDGAADPTFIASDIATSADNAHSVFAADMDNDGDMDVLSASVFDDTIAWYENDGAANPSFTASDIATSADGAYSVLAADMDNDGDMDILSASFNDDTIAWYENDGAADPTFTASDITTSADLASSVYAADLDNDGDMDVLSASGYDDTIAWYENNAVHRNAPFDSGVEIATSADNAMSVFAADMDNDGDVDVLSASYDNDTIAWYENDGAADPTFIASVIATTANGARSIYAADMDNDGDTDILSASYEDSTIAWYENDGAADPTFTASDIATSANGARYVFAADLDNDGDMDVLSASWSDGAIAWYENDGAADPTFTASDITTSAGFATSVFAADLDNDGDMDVLSTSALYNTITWYENDGATNPTFAASNIAISADDPYSVLAADMDNDGDLDVLSASWYDDTITWYENDGAANPTFTASNITTSADGAISVFATDLDNDGDLDILSASNSDNTIAWYENDGTADPTFTASDIATSADFAISVFAADLDNDGDLDVLSASRYDDTIAWYKNEGGSAGFVVTDTSPAAAVPTNGETDLLKVVFNHNGSSGDYDLALNQFNLDLLRSDCSTPLTTAEANNLIDTLRIRLDDGDGIFETTDTAVAEVETLSLTGGIQTISFTNNDPNVQIPVAGSKTYWFSFAATADADAQFPHEFCLNFDPDADALVEAKGTAVFSVSIQDTEATNAGVVTFAPRISINDVSLAEGDSGNTIFTFTVTRSSNNEAVSVDFATANGTAAAGSDYMVHSGTINFTVGGSLTQQISVLVNGDTQVETDETFTVTLSNVVGGGSLLDSQGVGTIQNDDSTLRIAATDADKGEGDSINTAFTFTVTRSGDTSGSSVVDYAVNGSGSDPADAADFGGTLPSGLLNFTVGEISQTITVYVSGDEVSEQDETFTITLFNPTGTTIDTGTATGTIQDDDTVYLFLPIIVNE